MTPVAEALREAPARTRRAPAAPRRRSGPATRRPAARTRRLTEHGRVAAVLDRLLRGRGWVMLIGALLAGIVLLNVSVLELNRGIASTNSRASALEAQNSVLRTRLADVGSAEAVQRAAEARGFVLPQPGDVGYLHLHASDAAAAARTLASAAETSAPASATPAVAPVQAAAAAPAAPVGPTAAASTAAAPVAPAAAPTAAAPSQAAAAPSAAPGVAGGR